MLPLSSLLNNPSSPSTASERHHIHLACLLANDGNDVTTQDARARPAFGGTSRAASHVPVTPASCIARRVRSGSVPCAVRCRHHPCRQKCDPNHQPAVDNSLRQHGSPRPGSLADFDHPTRASVLNLSPKSDPGVRIVRPPVSRVATVSAADLCQTGPSEGHGDITLQPHPPGDSPASNTVRPLSPHEQHISASCQLSAEKGSLWPFSTSPAPCHNHGERPQSPSCTAKIATSKDDSPACIQSSGCAPLQNAQRQHMVDSLEKALADLERDSQRRPPSGAAAAGAAQTEDTDSFTASLDSLAALEAEIALQHERLVAAGMRPRPAYATPFSPCPSSISVSDTLPCKPHWQPETLPNTKGATSIAISAAAWTSARELTNKDACGTHDGPCNGVRASSDRVSGHAPQQAPATATYSYPPHALMGTTSTYSTDSMLGGCRGSAEAGGEVSRRPCGSGAETLEERLKRLGLSVRPHVLGMAPVSGFVVCDSFSLQLLNECGYCMSGFHSQPVPLTTTGLAGPNLTASA
jgi:hypothetical protein